MPFQTKRAPAKVIRDENGLFVVVEPETSPRGSHDGPPSFDRPPDSGLGVPDISPIMRPFNDGPPDERPQERITRIAHISEVSPAPFLSDSLT